MSEAALEKHYEIRSVMKQNNNKCIFNTRTNQILKSNLIRKQIQCEQNGNSSCFKS